MKRKNIKRWMTGVAGATLMLNGCSAAIPEALPAPQEDPAPAKDLHVNGYKLEALEQAKVPEYLKVANVNGRFTFDQNVTTPPDEVFSIFGTALTGACAKPSFALGSEESAGDYYLNVSGSLKHAYRVNLNEVKDQEETRIMTCSCATGNAVVNADVAGVPLSAILRLDELEEHVNTITFRGADGFGIPMPLSYALEKNAMIVYRAGGQELPDNQQTQVWIPGTVAKYFTRNIVDIEVTAEAEEPELIGADAEYQTKVSIVNHAELADFTTGEEICFEGYADDQGSPIAAVEFSLDGGETWTTYETAGAAADKWVYWYFSYTPEEAGSYRLQVRAVTEDGHVSPLSSTLYFDVTDGSM